MCCSEIAVHRSIAPNRVARCGRITRECGGRETGPNLAKCHACLARLPKVIQRRAKAVQCIWRTRAIRCPRKAFQKRAGGISSLAKAVQRLTPMKMRSTA